MNKYLRLLSKHSLKEIIYRYCPHTPEDYCICRKPNIGLINDIFLTQKIDFKNYIHDIEKIENFKGNLKESDISFISKN